jgi:hypothetical protein
MKCCRRCELVKSRDLFTRRAAARDGLQTYCKACYAELADARRKADPVHAADIARKSLVKQRDVINERKRARRKANPEATKAQRRADYIKRREAELSVARIWKDANREHMRKQQAAKYWANPEAARAKQNAYLRANADKARAWRMGRIARQAAATPAWADLADIRAYYTLAKIYENALNEPFEVDHIVPLRGAVRRQHIVSGLHVGHNLQVLPKAANRQKLNTHWPDMPGSII